jgi:cation:H+ antiporter
MSLWMIFLLLAGFVLLIGGAELLVRGASQLAADLGISPLVIGLTVVAFGTSAPELAVSVLSAHSGQAGIALGNVVGSNICNVLLILGLSALVAPLVVARQVVRLEVPIMIGVSLLLLLFALDGIIGPWEGGLFFAGVIVYTVWTVRRSRRENREQSPPEEAPPAGGRSGRGVQILQIAGGLVLLGVGSKWLIDGAVSVASYFGVSDLVIGLTVVAIGTSLPELATSVLASLRGQRDIAVGNVVGSNIFNILVVLGLTAIFAPAGVPVPQSALTFDLPVMLAVAVACLPIFLTGHLIARWEGGLFFVYYLAYTLFIVLTALQHHGLSMFTQAMAGFVIPLTLVTLAISLWRAMQQKSRPG